ncbi:unnamed protein product, partial [Brachionus calyciflorus]
MPSSSIQVDTPISTVFNSVESNPSNILSMQAVSINNSNENAQKRGRGHPRKVDSLQKA